jgi:hypothetical protein
MMTFVLKFQKSSALNQKQRKAVAARDSFYAFEHDAKCALQGAIITVKQVVLDPYRESRSRSGIDSSLLIVSAFGLGFILDLAVRAIYHLKLIHKVVCLQRTKH